MRGLAVLEDAPGQRPVVPVIRLDQQDPAGLVAFILIITIPFGIAAWRIGGYVLWPFGRQIEWRRDAGIPSLIGNIIWAILLGWELALAHLLAGIGLCLTIIGIPLGLANFKIIPISLVPLGVRITSGDPF